MATEIAQAYVQLIPSARGIIGKIQAILNPEASAAGQSAGQSLGASDCSGWDWQGLFSGYP